MRWVGHVAHMGERRGAYRVMVGKREGKGPLGRHSRRRETIKIYLQHTGWGKWTGLLGSGQTSVAGSCEHGNERRVTMKGGKFDCLRKYQLLMEDFPLLSQSFNKLDCLVSHSDS
jgi:hypothetical protein